ncbi:hypothetical protein [Winogradskyella forsetii]|uniref:hypothetical protein n=1 Tax=Winogradskyella forsetii TaxID=2686077 RepID=UPI0015C085FB|nr:hypothetical protein [Winogradskyella forsetii]
MKQELTISKHEYGELKYYPAISGQIELRKLTDNLSILKLYFQKLRIIDEPDEMYFDNSTEVMLANFPIEITELDELDGMEIYIDEGFEGGALTTMLSVYDGEPINKSKIKFRLIKKDCFEIDWIGFWGEGNDNDENFKLHIIAYKENDVVTPLCEWEKDLIEKFDKK